MDLQQWLAILLLVSALSYLLYRLVGKRLRAIDDQQDPCGPDCNCS